MTGIDDTGQLATALLNQWHRIVDVVEKGLDLDRATRLPGWRNREVLAHLAMQPRLLRRFLAGPEPAAAEMDLASNLAGTQSLAQTIDQSTREAAAHNRLDLASGVAEVEPELRVVDLERTVATIQGLLPLADYLRTRLVEAVVHGCDLDPPVASDPEAARLAADALTRALTARYPAVTPPVDEPIAWLEIATGRRPGPPGWHTILPLTC